MILQIDSTVIQIPINNCFEPNLEYISLNIDEENGILFISTLDGDASASYAMLWIINNKKIITYS